MTYRVAPHATADDPAFIDPERVEEERRRECVGRFKGYLRRRGLLGDGCATGSREEAAQAMREAIARLRPSRSRSGAAVHPASGDPPRSFGHDLVELRRNLPDAELTLVEAINDCLHVELGREEDVLVIGEDVGRAGGVFRATAGLRERSGRTAASTPLAEAGILGSAVGLCMAGSRPVCEMQYDAFSYPASTS